MGRVAKIKREPGLIVEKDRRSGQGRSLPQEREVADSLKVLGEARAVLG